MDKQPKRDEMAQLAVDFRKLHAEGMLLIANIWDAGTARLVESLGAKAIATTSAGVAWSHAYADGDALPLSRLIATVTEIKRVISVPLSIDIEGGYSNDPVRVGELVKALLDAGAVGINLEDGSGHPEILAAKIEAARASAHQAGVPMFINARTDIYLRGLASPERAVEETLARASLYRSAGADGLFVPGLAKEGDIRAIASSLGIPLNVMAVPGLAAAEELESFGVRRLSLGSNVAQAAYGTVASMASHFLRSGNPASVHDHAMPYADLNKLMTQ